MKLSLLSGLLLQSNAFKLSEKEASQILSRKPRENPQINENSKLFGLVEGADDLERECIEGRAQWIMHIGLSPVRVALDGFCRAFLRKMQ